MIFKEFLELISKKMSRTDFKTPSSGQSLRENTITLACFAGVAATWFLPGAVWGQDPDTVEIKEWEVPYGASSRPRDPFVAPDGQIWFVGQNDDYAARFNPEDGEFTRFDLPDGAGPHNIIVDDWGRPWYSGNADAHIGRIDPETGNVTRFDTPTPEARDPHTQMFALDGGLWFTSQSGGSISRLDTGTGDVDVLTTSGNNTRPYGLVRGPDGILWADLFGTNRLARIDPVERELTEIVLPRSGSRPRRIGVTSDGMVWYGDYSEGYLGRYNPETEEIDEWQMPGGSGSRPYAMAVDDQDNVWFVETGSQPNMLVGFNPSTEEFDSQPIPSGGGVVRHMVFDPNTGTLWFGSDVGTLGGAVVSEPSTPVKPQGGGLETMESGSLQLRSRHSQLWVGLPPALRNVPILWRVKSLSGKSILKDERKSSPHPSPYFSLPLQNLATGLYVLEVEGGGRQLKGRFSLNQ